MDLPLSQIPTTTATAPCATPTPWRDEMSGQVFNAALDDLNGTHARGDDGLGPFRVLIPVSVAGWVLFGAACILCINGRGRAGRWVPEWYLDSAGTRRDKALVAAWWLAVLLLWPVILPALLVGSLVRRARKLAARKLAARKGRKSDEEAQMEEEHSES